MAVVHLDVLSLRPQTNTMSTLAAAWACYLPLRISFWAFGPQGEELLDGLHGRKLRSLSFICPLFELNWTWFLVSQSPVKVCRDFFFENEMITTNIYDYDITYLKVPSECLPYHGVTYKFALAGVRVNPLIPV